MRALLVLAAFCAIVFGGAAVGAGTPGISLSHRTVLTFSGPVSLPGVSLSAGSYTFEIADPDASGEAVVVKDRERSQVLYMGLTKFVRRPQNATYRSLVTFGEARDGRPTPIIAWYPSGELWGRQFIYGTQ